MCVLESFCLFEVRLHVEIREITNPFSVPRSVISCTGQLSSSLTIFKKYVAMLSCELLERATSSHKIFLLKLSVAPCIRNPNGLKGHCRAIWQLYKKPEGVFSSIEFQN